MSNNENSPSLQFLEYVGGVTAKSRKDGGMPDRAQQNLALKAIDPHQVFRRVLQEERTAPKRAKQLAVYAGRCEKTTDPLARVNRKKIARFAAQAAEDVIASERTPRGRHCDLRVLSGLADAFYHMNTPSGDLASPAEQGLNCIARAFEEERRPGAVPPRLGTSIALLNRAVGGSATLLRTVPIQGR